MSSGERIFLGIAIVWLGLWGMGSWLFFSGAASYDEEAERAAMPVTALEPGADVRIDGVVADVEDSVVAPLSLEPCAAARTNVYYRTQYADSKNQTRYVSELVTTLLSPRIASIRVGDEIVELPLQYWRPPTSRYADTTETFDALPARLPVADADLARARADNQGDPAGFLVEEWTMRGGEPLFVTGRLETRDGALSIVPGHGLDEVVLYRGTQADTVEHLRGEASGLRIAGSVFVGIAVMLVLPFGVHRVRARSRERRIEVG